MTVKAGFGSKKSSSAARRTVPGPSDEERLLQDLGIDLSKLQFDVLGGQADLQRLLTENVSDLFSPESLAETERLASTAGQLTSLEDELIRDIQEQSLALGESEIDRFVEEGLGLLKQEAAPARGLRFTDTPILDRGGDIVGEGIRQKAQLLRDVTQSAAEQRLNFPLQRQRFQELLRENARNFRLGLAGTTGQLGLGFASNPFRQQEIFLSERLAQPTETGTSKQRSFGLGFGREG